MKIQEILQQAIQKASGLPEVHLEHPQDLTHGDFATNVALQMAGKERKNAREVAEEIKAKLEADTSLEKVVQTIVVAGPGFINFALKPEFFAQVIANVDQDFGKNQKLKKQKAIIEYTDPNPFKVLHIGHLMSNTIGESLSRIIEWSGAETRRACYQGDVGMHVAKSLWGLIDMGFDSLPKEASLSEQVAYLGKAYAHGSTVYKEGAEEQKEEIKKINKQVYTKSDKAINDLYAWGRQVSLDYFETQYKQLGTKFDFYFFESEVAKPGEEVVKKFLKKNVFEESQGAIIFPGEKHGLHTRVFINSEGLPTYEAKELGLVNEKYKAYNYDLSVVVTGNEINQYFQVLLKAMSFVYPELEKKTKHVGHGMMRLPSGKMSSRTGTVIAAEDLLKQAEEKAREKETLGDESTYSQIAVAGVKFAILNQASGSDIIFDIEQSLSFEGDSGPYLQYTQARCLSVLRNAKEEKLKVDTKLPKVWQTTEVEKLLYRFPELVEKSLEDYSSHYIAHYLIDLAQAYNSFYAKNKIIGGEVDSLGYKLALTKATAQVIQNGLYLLGIESPERM